MSLARRASVNIMLKALGEFSRLAWALLLILVARRLGAESLGRIAFAFSFTTIIVLLTDLGMNVLVVREVARDRGAAGCYLGNLLSLKLVSAPVAFGLIAAAISLSGYSSDVVTVVLLFAGISIARGLLELYGAVFSGLEVMGREAVLKNLYQMGLFLSGGIALALGYGALGLSVALLIASLLTVLVGSGMVRRTMPGVRLLWDGALWLSMMRRGLPLAMTTIFIILYNDSDLILLSYLGKAEHEVGVYAAASKILKTLQLIPMLIVSGVYPVFSDLARGSKDALNTAYRGTLKLLLMIAIPLSIVVAIFADLFIRLIYGQGFTQAIPPLRLLALSIPFVYLGYVLVNVLVSSDHLAWAALATGGACTINVAANLLLIPVLGISGSAMAATATQVALVVIGGVATGRAVTRSRWIQLASKPIVAGAAMLLVVILVGRASWMFAFPAGLGAYLLALALTGSLREEEFAAVKRLWRGVALQKVRHL
ncbi:MAG TPA: flippase [Candidatus Methylomirabilis sp.]|nr:flippase [Candidatus Methylomirabilis sp.]